MKRRTRRVLSAVLACTVAWTSRLFLPGDGMGPADTSVRLVGRPRTPWLFFPGDGMAPADTSVRLVGRPMPPAPSGRRNRASKHPKRPVPPWHQGVSGRPHKNKKRRK